MRVIYWGIGLAAAMVGAAAGGVVYLRRPVVAHSQQSNSAQTRGDAASELGELQRELAQLRQQVGEMRIIQAAAKVAPEPRPNTTAAQPSANLPPEEAPIETETERDLAERERRNAEYYAQLEERLNSESRDAAWARAAEGELAKAVEAIRNAGYKSARVENAQCASTICRATFAYASAEERRAAMHELHAEGFKRTTFHGYTEGGQFKSIAYFSREGHRL